MAGRLRGDEGFSLLEVMFASFIAFFVLTALFGVLVMSATEGRIANADTVSTNLAQLVVEQARSIPYASVGVTPTPSGEIAGQLPSTEETVFQNMTFTIRRHVVWVHDEYSPVADSKDYKQLSVDVSWPGGHATPVITYIRDHTNDSPIPPLVAWAESPPANAVLFSDPDNANRTVIWDRLLGTWGDGGTASLQASASIVATTGTVNRMEFQCNGKLLGTPWTGPAAPYVLYPESDAYPIDLTIPSGETTTPYREGLNTLKVVATANNLAYAYQILLVTIDNEPPEFQTGASIIMGLPPDNTDRYNGSLDMTWTPALDGNDVAPYYDLTISPCGPSAVPLGLSMVNLGGTGTWLLGTGHPAGFTAMPFSPYHVTLRGRSIRGLSGSSSASNAGYTSTSVRLTGSVYNQAANKKADNNFRFDLTMSAPSPDASSVAAAFGGKSIVYDVYSQSAVGYTYPGYGDLPSTAFLEADNEPYSDPIPVQSGLVCNKYLQVEAKVLASDTVTVVQRIRSNVVGALVTGPEYKQSAPLPIP